MHYLYLGLAIIAEVTATSALKASASFSRLTPSIAVVIGYGLSFWLLSLALRSIPVGIAYGIWSGIGIVLISAIGWIVFRQSLDTPAIIGLALIIAGVAVINLFSNSVTQ